MMANLILQDYLSEKDTVLALANSILDAHISDTKDQESNDQLLQSKRSELARLSRKMDNLIEMRADGDISREMFRTKCNELEPKIRQIQAEIEHLSAPTQLAEKVPSYEEKLTFLHYALEKYTHPEEGEDVPPHVVEAFVTKIVAGKDGFDWYLRFNGDPDRPLRCKLEGKRRTTTKINISDRNSPAAAEGSAGCYQNWGGLICTSSFPSVTRKLRRIEKPRVSI